MNTIQYDLARTAYTAYHAETEQSNVLFDNLPYIKKQRWFAVVEAVASALTALMRGV